MGDTLELPLVPDELPANRRRRRTLGELVLLILLLLLLFLSCGWLSVIGTREPAQADTSSLMRADYSPWPFLVFQVVNPDILEEIAKETGKDTEPLDLTAGGTVVGWFFWTPEPTGGVTPTAPATSTAVVVSNTPGVSASATWTSSPTRTPSRTPTRTPSLTRTPTFTATFTATPTRTST